MAQSLALQAYEALKRDIISCALSPGAMVVEGTLARHYGMSKTPIREALGLLAKEGFVQSVPRRGTLIAPISVSDVQHTFFLRMLLEPEAAALAAQRVTEPQLDELEILLEAASDTTDGDPSPAEIFGANRRFHTAVADAAGVPPLAAMIGGVLEQVERFYNSHPMGAGHGPHNRRHDDLLRALRTHDAQAAKTVATESIRRSRQHLLTSMIEDPTVFSPFTAAAL